PRLGFDGRPPPVPPSARAGLRGHPRGSSVALQRRPFITEEVAQQKAGPLPTSFDGPDRGLEQLCRLGLSEALIEKDVEGLSFLIRQRLDTAVKVAPFKGVAGLASGVGGRIRRKS